MAVPLLLLVNHVVSDSGYRLEDGGLWALRKGQHRFLINECDSVVLHGTLGMIEGHARDYHRHRFFYIVFRVGEASYYLSSVFLPDHPALMKELVKLDARAQVFPIIDR